MNLHQYQSKLLIKYLIDILISQSLNRLSSLKPSINSHYKLLKLSPSHLHFISSKSLCNMTLVQIHPQTRIVHKASSIGNHCSIINTVPLVHCSESSVSLLEHLSHNLLKSLIAANSSHNQNLIRIDMRESPLSHLSQHAENCLL